MKSKSFLNIVVVLVCCVFLASPVWGGGKKSSGHIAGTGVSPWTGTYSLDGATIDGAAWDGSQTLITGTTYDVALTFSWIPQTTDTNDVEDPIWNMYDQGHSVNMVIDGQLVWGNAFLFPMTVDDYNNTPFPVPTLTQTVSAPLLYTGTINPEGLYEAEITRISQGDLYDDVWGLDVMMMNPGSNQVSEPSTLLLLCVGILGAVALASRRQTDPTI
jgi:hypothetical protein